VAVVAPSDHVMASTTEQVQTDQCEEDRASTVDTEDTDEDAVSVASIQPTRDALQEGLLGLLRPTVAALDARVSATRQAQHDLRSHIEALKADLATLAASNEADQHRREVEEAVERLNSAKKRVATVANVLQAAQVRRPENVKPNLNIIAIAIAMAFPCQDRLNRIHQGCLRETSRRRATLDLHDDEPTRDKK
jgi:hypothetical protein